MMTYPFIRSLQACHPSHWTVNILAPLFACVYQNVPYSPNILQTTVARVRDGQQWMNVELFYRSEPWRLAEPGLLTRLSWFNTAQVCSVQIWSCWILIPPSDIRPIDFFPEGCFCLHNYSIDFKQRGSSICPRVLFFFFWERNNTKNRPVLSVVVFLAYARAPQH